MNYYGLDSHETLTNLSRIPVYISLLYIQCIYMVRLCSIIITLVSKAVTVIDVECMSVIFTSIEPLVFLIHHSFISFN